MKKKIIRSLSLTLILLIGFLTLTPNLVYCQNTSTITINGVKWATANITGDDCDPNGNCTKLKIADSPYERGLFFQFQWHEGNSNENTIIGYSNSGAWDSTPRYVQPGKADFPNQWPSYEPVYRPTKGNWTANNPCTLIGGSWRLPTKAEIIATYQAYEVFGYSMVGWTYQATNGGYFKHTASGLIFPLSGRRSHIDGSLGYQGTGGIYWSSTEFSSVGAWWLFFNSSRGLYINSCGKTRGLSVRCVQD